MTHDPDAAERLARNLDPETSWTVRLTADDARDAAALIRAQAAEIARLLAICRDVPGALNAAFAAGAEECEGGSARRQERALAPVDDMRKRIRATLNQGTIND